MADCLFCNIIEGAIPSAKAYEDDVCYAFDDIAPEAPVHTLIVPKQHFASLNDGVPADLLGQLMARVPEIAKIKGIDESGYRVVVNTGADAGQTVFHFHIHILGGKNLGEHVL